MAAACRHFGHCGGCSDLETALDDQLRVKRDGIATLLAPWLRSRREALEIELADVPSATHVQARTKLLYPSQPRGDGSLTLGLYARGTHEPVEITECVVQDPALTTLGKRALAIVRDRRLVSYDERDGSGSVRALFARLLPGTDELLIGIVTRTPRLDDGPALARDLVDACRDLRSAAGAPVPVVGVVHDVNDRPGNALLGRTQHPLVGADAQHDVVAGPGRDLRFRVSYGSFYQVHRNVDELLYRPALNLIGALAGVRRAVDGFAGVGTFGVRLAAAGVETVTCIEDHPRAAADCTANARANDRADRIRVEHSRFDDATLSPDGARPDLLVVDPTRKGLGATGCARILDARPERIVYAACGPPALARDLERLGRAYDVTRVHLADLFPFTPHVEVIALLERTA